MCDPMDFITLFVTVVPWIELRGAIPIAVAKSETELIPLIMIINMFLFFPVYFVLEFFYDKFFSKIKFIRKKLESIRKRGKPYVDKYGLLGLAVFIGIPLPGSGVYSGTILAWLLGIKWKKGFVTVIIGVIIATVIVSIISFGVVKGISILR